MPTQPGPFKLLADFDGVWTDPSPEAKRVREFMVSVWNRMTGAALPEIQGFLEAAEAAVRSKPDENGWVISGRISAYADEDEFVFCNAVGGWLDRIGATAYPRVAAQ